MLEILMNNIFKSRYDKLYEVIDKAGADKIKKKILHTDNSLDRESEINRLINLTIEKAYKRGFKDGLVLLNEIRKI